ncbi:hypothetical protein [Prauserella muralis]|uniref:Uncharacterized protein n=1 Tax=Prauserella muralis TaxID=588067 RepID=A0A2V4BB07_9PSEU|nr:hypothetical protein [Prauserella muralis]PXY32507.1 hypothetical protein BAY60_09660 [Prauserella muralis]TWE23788.1 hypothetical protein FHX69_5088 [Prauserella muralis]
MEDHGAAERDVPGSGRPARVRVLTPVEVAESAPDGVLVSTVEREPDSAIELWELATGQRVVVGYSTFTALAASCGTGQRLGEQAGRMERALRDFADALGGVIRRMDDARGKASLGGLRIEGPFMRGR